LIQPSVVVSMASRNAVMPSSSCCRQLKPAA
jgi:hypothetical protein